MKKGRKRKKELQGSDSQIEMHIMAAYTVLFGTDSSCFQVRDLKCCFF